ncbi:MAG TPA: thiamine pyrophosphate-binding protein, partial [Gammaproteobacteria bacterium]|nr:thiamine pyrophosphate-binding protein [Gammaproteobacteria bacterium]
MPIGGQLIVACLEAQGTDRVFCVPGESYLPVLDALYDSPIETIVARQEGGAAMMAEADGKATGRPGICFVTRGPGASNAMSGVHVAQQDSTPLILFIGQVAREFRGRDAFQEMDFETTFSAVAKLTLEINHTSKIPEVMSQAFNTAINGRPGPVVISLPEDMLTDETNAQPCALVTPEENVPQKKTIDEFEALLRAAKAPVVIVGGSRWNAESVNKVQRWANSNKIPVTASFRRQHLFDNLDAAYIGDLGIGANPELLGLIEKSDLVILLGGRLSEIPSQSFTL